MNYKHGLYCASPYLTEEQLQMKRKKEREYMQQYRARKAQQAKQAKQAATK